MSNANKVITKQKSNVLGRKRVSDVITRTDVEQWKQGDIITISAGCGVGKSYFVKEILYKYAKEHNYKIIMFIHRKNCVDAFNFELKGDKKDDIITVTSYQKLENDKLNDRFEDLNNYHFIVCDEFHYFIDDAGFAKCTDISFDYIMNNTPDSIKICMSATGDNIEEYLKLMCDKPTIKYTVPYNYDYIDDILFYTKNSTLDDMVDLIIKQNQKAIVFIQSAKRAYSLHKKYKKNSIFVCATGNRRYSKYVDEQKKNDMLANERFEENILFTTSCFDAGINIVDKSVRYVIVDIKDVASFIQCVGRRRVDYNDPDDKFVLIIKNISNRQLEHSITKTQKAIEKAEYAKEHTTEEYISKYFRESDNIVYFDTCNGVCKACVNELMLYKNKQNLKLYEAILEKGKLGYRMHMEEIFDLTPQFNKYGERKYKYIYDTAETIFENKSLITYLNDNVGEYMPTVESRKELIQKINLRSDGSKLIKTRETLNSYLANDLKSDFVIRKISKKINGKMYRSVWVIDKI